ncbi:YqzM family protein [Alkalihalobacillus sp. AL-G]|nr:YqzM family protein [Alkalihalobacillus sp. AL-G]WLD92145.1 YqzM family protein [Alkalihalobacillus sp. AL-G]
MNDFEKDVQTKTNDVVDSGLGFIYSFLFFTVIFFIGVIIKAVAL